MSNKTTLTIALNEDQIKGMEAMIELGTADRRDHLASLPAKTDLTDKEFVFGHYEADCADDAIESLRTAFDKANSEVTWAIKYVKANTKGFTPGDDLAITELDTEKRLNVAFEFFCTLERLPMISANELLNDEQDREEPSPLRIEWLTQFIKQWEAVME